MKKSILVENFFFKAINFQKRPNHLNIRIKNDEMVEELCSQLNNKDKYKKILLEGEKLITDALKLHIMPEYIFYQTPFNIKKFYTKIQTLIEGDLECYRILKKTMLKISQVETPPGICGLFSLQNCLDQAINKRVETIPLNVVCDNIRDPGNLGTLIRTMGAIGTLSVILLKGCVNPWEPKVIRSGAGGHFRVPICSDVSVTDLEEHIQCPSKLLIAQNFESQDQGVVSESGLHTIPSIRYTDLKSFIRSLAPISLILGNESRGLSPELRDWLTVRMTKDGVEEPRLIMKTVNIPMVRGTESLNVSVAGAIIAYEIKRIFEKMPSSCNKLD